MIYFTGIDFDVGAPVQDYVESSLWFIPALQPKTFEQSAVCLNVGEPCACLYCNLRGESAFIYRYAPPALFDHCPVYYPQAE